MKKQVDLKHFSYCFLLFALMSVILFACSHNKGEGNPPSHKQVHYKKKNFDTLLRAVAKQVPAEMDELDQYMESDAFEEIFDHGSSYFPDVKKLLMSHHFTDTQAFICVLAMQNLGVDDYVELGNMYLTLYNDHLISEGTLEAVIIPNFLSINILKDNKYDPKVITFLDAVHHAKISTDFKDIVEIVGNGVVP